MTIEELLGLTKPVREHTDAELEAALAPFFPDTRPAEPKNFQVEKAKKATFTGDVGEMLKKALADEGLDEHGNPIPKNSNPAFAALFKKRK